MTVQQKDIIQIPISQNNILWAAETAIRKLPHTFRGFQTSRMILDNLFQGDLAKNALIDYLTNQGKTITNEYDSIRTDYFMQANSNGYVFLENGKRVEVNSSKVPNLNHSLSYRLQNYDLKVTAQDTNGVWTFPKDLPYDISYQLYFETDKNYVPSNYQQLLTAIQQSYKNNNNNINFNNIQPLISQLIIDLEVKNRFASTLYGYAQTTPQNIEQIRQNNITNGLSPTWSYPNVTREWWICKLKDCSPI